MDIVGSHTNVFGPDGRQVVIVQPEQRRIPEAQQSVGYVILLLSLGLLGFPIFIVGFSVFCVGLSKLPDPIGHPPLLVGGILFGIGAFVLLLFFWAKCCSNRSHDKIVKRHMYEPERMSAVEDIHPMVSHQSPNSPAGLSPYHRFMLLRGNQSEPSVVSMSGEMTFVNQTSSPQPNYTASLGRNQGQRVIGSHGLQQPLLRSQDGLQYNNLSGNRTGLLQADSGISNLEVDRRRREPLGGYNRRSQPPDIPETYPLEYQSGQPYGDGVFHTMPRTTTEVSYGQLSPNRSCASEVNLDQVISDMMALSSSIADLDTRSHRSTFPRRETYQPPKPTSSLSGRMSPYENS